MNLCGRYISADQLGWDLKGPCNDCPFRKNAPEHEGVAAAIPGYIESIREHRFSHTCHKTDNEADGPKNHKGKIQHCAGALHFMVKARCDLQRPLLQAIDAGQLDVHAMCKRARRDKRVFGSIKQLVNYYAAMAQRILQKRRDDPVVCVIRDDGPSDRPELVALSVARQQGLSVLECCICGQPAIEADKYWPYYMDRNFCAEHGSGGALVEAAEQLSIQESEKKQEPEVSA